MPPIPSTSSVVAIVVALCIISSSSRQSYPRSLNAMLTPVSSDPIDRILASSTMFSIEPPPSYFVMAVDSALSAAPSIQTVIISPVVGGATKLEIVQALAEIVASSLCTSPFFAHLTVPVPLEVPDMLIGTVTSTFT